MTTTYSHREIAPDTEERARLAAAVAYVQARKQLERRAKAAVRARRWALVARLAEQARALDAQALA